jgi:hypothetical protein
MSLKFLVCIDLKTINHAPCRLSLGEISNTSIIHLTKSNYTDSRLVF